MDGSIRAVRPYANRGEKEGVAFLGLNPRPITLGVEVSVMILYADAVVAAGLAAVLREHGGFQEAFALVSKEQDDHDGAIGALWILKGYDQITDLLTDSPVIWISGDADWLGSAARKRMIERWQLPEYWRAHGFPPQCKALAQGDFCNW